MKKTLPFILVLLVLGTTLYFLTQKDRDTSNLALSTEFAIADTAAIDRIFIADNRGNKADLVRSDTGWVVNGKYLAKTNGINVLLKTFKRAFIKSPVPKSAQENVLRVMSSTSKRVEIFMGNDEPSKIWHVGHSTPDHFGTYMILETPGQGRGKDPFILSMQGFTGHLYSRFFADELDWRRSDIFRYNARDIRTVRIGFPAIPEENFELHFDGENTFELSAQNNKEIANFDTIAAKDLLMNLQRVNYEMFAKGVDAVMADSILNTEPYYTIEIIDKNGAHNELSVYYKLAAPNELDQDGEPALNDIDRYLALLPSGDFVIVQSFSFDRIGVGLSYFKPRPDNGKLVQDP